MPTIVAHAAGLSNIGPFREKNEDALFVDEVNHVYIVADGMGGCRNEEVPDVACYGCLQFHRAFLQEMENEESLVDNMLMALRHADQEIRQLSLLPDAKHIATTIVAAVMDDDEVHIGWLGDSRAYLVRGTEVRRLTRDHDLRNALISAGTIAEAEAYQLRIKNVLTAVLGGGYDGWINSIGEYGWYTSYAPQAGDWLLLLTDGVYGILEESRFASSCTPSASPQDVANELIAFAIEDGARDNLTCVAIHLTLP